jgi:hypothetical protein
VPVLTLHEIFVAGADIMPAPSIMCICPEDKPPFPIISPEISRFLAGYALK